MSRRSGPSIIYTGGTNAGFGSAAGVAVGDEFGAGGANAGTGGLAYFGAGGANAGTGGLAYFGAGDAVVLAGQAGQSGQSGQSVKYGPTPITLSDVFSAGSVEGAANLIARGQLLHNVSRLPAHPIVNAINTLSGEKDFVLEDWVQIGVECKADQFEIGLLDTAGRVQAMFQADGTAYVKAKNAAGTMAWAKLNYSSMTPALKYSSMTTAVEGASQQEFGSPEVTADRLGSIAKGAKIQLGVSNFMGTDRAYKYSALPSVLGNGDLKFVKATSYTGVTAPIPDSSYMIVGAKLIGLGVSSSANIGNNISLPSSLQASLSELVTKLNYELDSLIIDNPNYTQDQKIELQEKILQLETLLAQNISDLISNPKDIL